MKTLKGNLNFSSRNSDGKRGAVWSRDAVARTLRESESLRTQETALEVPYNLVQKLVHLEMNVGEC
jgi:hypothetical protein